MYFEYLLYFPALSIPLALNALTMNGVADSVIEILTGANTLCTAYATTKVDAPLPNWLPAICSPMYGMCET